MVERVGEGGVGVAIRMNDGLQIREMGNGYGAGRDLGGTWAAVKVRGMGRGAD